MSLMTRILGASAAAITLSATAALAEPAVIYDLGGKFDKSFNEAAYHGAEKWSKDTGKKFREIEIQSEAQREQVLRRLAQMGANPIVMTGFAFGDTLNKVAPQFPKTKFVIIDDVVKQPNVQSVIFSEDQGSYLVGILAAMASKTHTVSFVGGMDIPLIRKFECGYAQGVKSVDPTAKVIVNYTGTTPAAWNDPVKGGEIAKSQISQGSDVVYAAAGGTGVGVLQAAADAKVLSIGVDSDQNYLHPGQVLTSMEKRVDNAVYEAFKAGDALKPGVKMMDLKAGGVAAAMDKYNAPLITPAMKTALEKATKGIDDGTIKVHDYTTDNTCPVK